MEKTFYKILADDIVSKIKTGVYLPGEKLPSETELCNIYNMSKTTVSNATRLLISQGVIYSVPKVGCFVSKTTGKEFSLNYNPYTTMLKLCDDSRLLGFELKGDSDIFPFVLNYRLLFLKEGKPVFLSDASVCLEDGNNIDVEKIKDMNFLTMISDHHDMISLHKKLTISAVSADKNTASFLEIEQGEALLFVKLEFFNLRNILVASIYSYYPSDNFSLFMSEKKEHF